MTEIADNVKADWQNTLDEYGRDATLQKTVAGTYSPDAGTQSGTVTEYNLRVMTYGYNERNIDGARILAEDRRIIVAPEVTVTVTDGEEVVAISPAVTDKVVVGSVTFTIINVRPHEIQGEIIGWLLQGRP